MGYQNRCSDRVLRLMEKGVDIPNPLSIALDDRVDPDRISGDGVRIEAGCRLAGEETVICRGVRLGREGPVTLENCQLGPGVEFKGGYAREATFLESSSMGLGAHVREGCLLEEEASGAHCVGLKQTILFPFVTLGSLINFCDCLMAGGTSRRDHSEVGSSYIHFNFTPDGEKATPSLLGDVPRGVMLNRRPIFLGGQGGMVGPCRVEYGNVVAAGTILRRDLLEQDKLFVGGSSRGGVFGFVPRAYSGAGRVVEKNILYLANLSALEQWYEHARRPFLERIEFGDLIYAGTRKRLTSAKAERIKRLKALVRNMKESAGPAGGTGGAARPARELAERFDEIASLFDPGALSAGGEPERDAFIEFMVAELRHGAPYLQAVQSLSQEAAETGTRWLQGVVDNLCRRTAGLLPGLRIFRALSG
jgi:bifunctional UDP-N-acetylglucosamine pyrophosphorylase / glucosamine-1-phosphate N-acetyltransferase